MSNANQYTGMRLLGVFAHPDDEVFCIGGTLAKYVAGGAEAMVVSFTRGEAGQIRDATVATRRTLGHTREQELYASCKQLGAQHVVCMDYGDGKLEDIPQDTLVRQAVKIIRQFQPDIVFTFDETGGYGHPDHIAISRATTTACRLAGDATHFSDQIESGLSPHTPKRLYHSYFPRNSRRLLDLIVQWLRGLDTKFHGTDEFIHGLMLFADESTMIGYASDHIDVQWYPPGFYIIEQGEPATSLYLILSGHVNIYEEDEEGNVQYIISRGPGVFVGEIGLAYGQPRNAHVVAAHSVTCLVFSPAAPTEYAGRGEEAQFATVAGDSELQDHNIATTSIDVCSYVMQKVAAMSQHRSQYPISTDMFPQNMLEKLLGREYFVRIPLRSGMNSELLPSR